MEALSVLENTIFSIPRYFFFQIDLMKLDPFQIIARLWFSQLKIAGHQPSRTFLDMGSNGLITRSVRATVVIVMRTLCLLHVWGKPNIGKGATFDQ